MEKVGKEKRNLLLIKRLSYVHRELCLRLGVDGGKCSAFIYLSAEVMMIIHLSWRFSSSAVYECFIGDYHFQTERRAWVKEAVEWK